MDRKTRTVVESMSIVIGIFAMYGVLILVFNS